ncbi:crossover junction endodeoxyribonuclease RuvC [Pokkaliibacter sp. MBI-7]|uniref:crossover junction endodeoxyribonuclease RuvC n=1 Tax=Pokkaliibacter sp. MBI-7 TaxID=3040600 RepID=UPI00244C296B|nr:crossover junction endodeoxyribonuclease RuvC [Pokkaliibacter sp. MBI-7]MDH2431174.1 crossover junction endodeoxyribonuclease RuvC [Pokkaliibacter sp. MBI-7]
MSVIIGIDPGSRITGYGVIRFEAGRLSYVASGCVRITAEGLPLRLKQIQDALHELVAWHKPDEAAIERVFMARNADSALKLGQARGVAIVTLASHGLTVAEYAAKEVKQAVVGKGSADKVQVQHMVMALLKLPGLPQADAADALGIAICHAHRSASVTRIQEQQLRSYTGRVRG